MVFSKNTTLDLCNEPFTTHIKWNLLGCDVSKLPVTFNSTSVSFSLMYILNLLLLDPTP